MEEVLPMAQLRTHHLAKQQKDPEPPPLAPLAIIRTETVLSRLPIHNLSKKGRVHIHITQKNAKGEIELYWKVSPNADFGEPRQLAYKLDTLIINRRINELGRPLPKVIRLDSFKQIGKTLEVSEGGRTNGKVKQALHENAGAYITAKLYYKAHDGTERTLEAGFTRYSVVFTGERLPDGTTADAVYLLLNEPYWEVLNSAPTRPLDYDYLKALPPAAQRCYELLSYKMFTALKYRHPHAKLLYSEYCTFSAQQRYADYDHVKKQMYKIHKPHIASEYLASVRYEATTDEDGRPDWMMYYVPGSKARAEYAAFNTRPRRRAADQAAVPHLVVPAEESTPASPPAVDTSTADAHALVQYFHQRFHATPDATPSVKEITQARTLIATYGVEQARYVVDFSVTAAQETTYQPQTFSGIVQYTARALADYEKAQQRRAAEARAQDERRRAQADDERHAQYEAYRAERLAQLRASLPPDVLAAIEEAAAAQFEREHTSAFGREVLRRAALDHAVAAYGQIPSFAAWHPGLEPC